jgi:XTP/dITP diphosphohydrolase
VHNPHSFFNFKTLLTVKKIVFATNNAHKLEELRRMAGDKFEILSLSDINCHEEIPETADTLQGNALQKAHWINDRYGVDCFADDTGLEVDALGGDPGVRTARYAGEHCDPADNMRLLLHNLEGETNRHATFRTVIALILHGEEHIFNGAVEGIITEQQSGKAGFGYDPVFQPLGWNKTFAEADPDEKNAISHRGRAVEGLINYLLSL